MMRRELGSKPSRRRKTLRFGRINIQNISRDFRTKRKNFHGQEKKFSCLKLAYLESKRKKQRKFSLKNCTMMAVCP
jgi:hypothetical protein